LSPAPASSKVAAREAEDWVAAAAAVVFSKPELPRVISSLAAGLTQTCTSLDAHEAGLNVERQIVELTDD